VTRTRNLSPAPAYRKLLDDFIFGDRRIADRADIELNIEWIASWKRERSKFEDAVQRMDDVAVPRKASIHLFRTPAGEFGVVELSALHELSGREGKLVPLLASLVAYSQLTFAEHRTSHLPGTIGTALKEVRESLGITQTDLAKELNTSRITVSRWESGAQSPVRMRCTDGVTPLDLLALPIQPSSVS
jgi:DNA-binding XRE family transcriptional regulator